MSTQTTSVHPAEFNGGATSFFRAASVAHRAQSWTRTLMPKLFIAAMLTAAASSTLGIFLVAPAGGSLYN